jgi:L-cysteine desulfidase
MIEIKGREQFKNADARIRKERMFARRFERGAYTVVNTKKSHAYIVRFTRIDGKVFGQCDCEAGTPSRRNATPMVCKHLFVAVLLHNALNSARRKAAAAVESIPVFDDADDADSDINNWQ